MDALASQPGAPGRAAQRWRRLRLRSTQPLTLGQLEADLDPEDRAQLRQLLALLNTFGLLSAA